MDLMRETQGLVGNLTALVEHQVGKAARADELGHRTRRSVQRLNNESRRTQQQDRSLLSVGDNF